MAKRQDIKPRLVPELNWSKEQRAESLNALAKHAEESADRAIEWYLSSKASKRRGARSLRIGAILLTAAAGILPVVTQIWKTSGDQPVIAPAWASVLAAIAVLLILLDKFLGFSSGWMRYVQAGTTLTKVRNAFAIDWQRNLALSGTVVSANELRVAFEMIRAFADQVDAVVASETTEWVKEFQKALQQIEENAQATPSVPGQGSLAIVVENGDQVSGDGWSLSLNGDSKRVYTGKTAAFSGLVPGDCVVVVRGTIGDKTVSAEGVARVRAGEVAKVTMTLE